MRDAFAGTGGQLTFVQAAAFGRDRHSLFAAGIPQWTPAVDKFFQGERLVLRDGLLPLPPLPTLTIPANLSSSGREAFEKYRAVAPHKAFAASPGGS